MEGDGQRVPRTRPGPRERGGGTAQDQGGRVGLGKMLTGEDGMGLGGYGVQRMSMVDNV